MSDPPRIRTPEEVPGFIVELVRSYVPFDYGGAKFKEVCRDYVMPYGTTCGFLPIWALWRAGCRDPKFINRTDPDSGLIYKNGANLARLWNKGHPPFEPYVADMTFTPGDILYIYDGLDGAGHNPNTEHVFIYLDSEVDEVDGKTYMISADAGQTNAKGQQAAKILKRLWNGRSIGKNADRKIVGRLSPSKLTYVAESSLSLPDTEQ